MTVAPRQIRRILPIAVRICVLLALAFSVFIGALFGYTAVHRAQEVTLPAPTGPFAVGRTIEEWTDTSRSDPLGQAPNVPRELQVWIWYPADPTTSAPRAPYVPADSLQAGDADLGIGRFLRQDPGTVQSHARANPPIAGKASRFPVVIFEPGYGFVPANYTAVLENLACQGYLVVGIVPTDMAPVVAFSDGRTMSRSPAGQLPDEAPPLVLDPLVARLVDVSADDVRFVLDRLQAIDAQSSGTFASRIDLSRVAVVGHSLGGATALEVCRTDSRCGAAVDVDGTPVGQSVSSGINRPLLMLQYGASAGSDEVQKISLVMTHSTGPRLHLEVAGAAHLNGSDYAVMFEPIFQLAGVLGSIDGRRGLDLTSAYLVAFLDEYLKGNSTSLLSGPSSAYPEVRFVSPSG